MSHPSTEQWMAYLYGEVPRSQASSLRAHLQACGDCQEQFHVWQSARKDLSKWTLHSEDIPTRTERFFPMVKWAMAALVVLGLGYTVGRVSAPQVDVLALRAAIEPALKASLLSQASQQAQTGLLQDWQAVLSGPRETIDTPLRRELKASVDQWTARLVAEAEVATQQRLADFAEQYQANRRADRAVALTLFDQAEAARRAEHLSLRRAVETVAVVADDKFARTESELGQLANDAQAQARFVSDPFDPSSSHQNHPTTKDQ